MTQTKTRALVEGALIAALYTALSLALSFLSFGQMQIRVAEALTLLPLFSRSGIWGVTVGCLMTNVFGLFLGANILGPLDIVFGTLATLIAALLTRALQKPTVKGLPLLAPLPPVILNAVVVGLELTYLMMGGFDLGVFLLNAAYVGAGEVIACYGLGLLMVWTIHRKGLAQKLFAS